MFIQYEGIYVCKKNEEREKEEEESEALSTVERDFLLPYVNNNRPKKRD